MDSMASPHLGVTRAVRGLNRQKSASKTVLDATVGGGKNRVPKTPGEWVSKPGIRNGGKIDETGRMSTQGWGFVHYELTWKQTQKKA